VLGWRTNDDTISDTVLVLLLINGNGAIEHPFPELEAAVAESIWLTALREMRQRGGGRLLERRPVVTFRKFLVDGKSGKELKRRWKEIGTLKLEKSKFCIFWSCLIRIFEIERAFN
jgi:hypothetical protein